MSSPRCVIAAPSFAPRPLLPSANAEALALALLLGALGPAGATASLTCSATDRSLAFSAQAIVGHGLGEALSGFRGNIQLLMRNTPEALRELEFAGEHLTHHWVNGRELKLRLFREGAGDSGGSVELVVETRAVTNDDPKHRGSYLLNVTLPLVEGHPKTLKARGRATCSLG